MPTIWFWKPHGYCDLPILRLVGPVLLQSLKPDMQTMIGVHANCSSVGYKRFTWHFHLNYFTFCHFLLRELANSQAICSSDGGVSCKNDITCWIIIIFISIVNSTFWVYRAPNLTATKILLMMSTTKVRIETTRLENIAKWIDLYGLRKTKLQIILINN